MLDASVDAGTQQNPDDGSADVQMENQPEMEQGSVHGNNPEAATAPQDLVGNIFDQDLKVILISNALEEIEAISQAAVDDAQVIVYDAGTENLASIGQTLGNLVSAAGHRIDQLAFVTHGMPGVLGLSESQGFSFLDVINNPAVWEDLGGLLTEDARIDLYGCDIGRGEIGLMLVESISEVTGATVWASNDATGNVAGADWDLEVQSDASVLGNLLDPETVAGIPIELPISPEVSSDPLFNLDFETGDLAGWLFITADVEAEVISSDQGFPAAGYPFANSEHLLFVQAPDDAPGQLFMYRVFDTDSESLSIDHAWFSRHPMSMYIYMYGIEPEYGDAQAISHVHMGSFFDVGEDGPNIHRSDQYNGFVYDENPEDLAFRDDWQISFSQGWTIVSHGAPSHTELGLIGISVLLFPGATAYLDFHVEVLQSNSQAVESQDFSSVPTPLYDVFSFPAEDGVAGDLWRSPLFSTSDEGTSGNDLSLLEVFFAGLGSQVMGFPEIQTSNYGTNPQSGNWNTGGGFPDDAGGSSGLSTAQGTVDLDLSLASTHGQTSWSGSQTDWFEGAFEVLLRFVPESVYLPATAYVNSTVFQGTAESEAVYDYGLCDIRFELKPWELPPVAAQESGLDTDIPASHDNAKTQTIDQVQAPVPAANDARLMQFNLDEVKLAHVLVGGAEGTFEPVGAGVSFALVQAMVSGRNTAFDPAEMSLHDILALELTDHANTGPGSLAGHVASSDVLSAAQTGVLDLSALALGDVLATG